MPLWNAVFALFVLQGLLPAQVGPGQSVPLRLSPFFDLSIPNGPFAAWNNNTSTEFIGVGGVAVPGTTNQWYIGLSMRLPVAGRGLAELRFGTYTQAVPGTSTPGTFAWDTQQDPIFNTTAGERMVQFDPTATIAVFERVVNPNPTVLLGVYVADRPSITSAFNPPQPVLGIRGLSGNYADPAIGTFFDPVTQVRKQMLFYVGSLAATSTGAPQQGLWMDELRLNRTYNGVTGNFSGFAPRLIAVPSAPGLEVHSPTPIVGRDGDVEGLWYSEVDRATSISNQWLADDLDPATPGVLVWTNGSWLNNGVILGGQLLAADNPLQLAEAWGAWTLGDHEPCGSPNPIDFTVGGLPGSTAFVFLSAGLAVMPLPVPGTIGQLCLDNPFAFTGLLFTLDANGLGGASIPTPPPTGPLCGTIWYTQSAVVEANTNNIVLTNTARIRI